MAVAAKPFLYISGWKLLRPCHLFILWLTPEWVQQGQSSSLLQEILWRESDPPAEPPNIIEISRQISRVKNQPLRNLPGENFHWFQLCLIHHKTLEKAVHWLVFWDRFSYYRGHTDTHKGDEQMQYIFFEEERKTLPFISLQISMTKQEWTCQRGGCNSCLLWILFQCNKADRL